MSDQLIIAAFMLVVLVVIMAALSAADKRIKDNNAEGLKRHAKKMHRDSVDERKKAHRGVEL